MKKILLIALVCVFVGCSEPPAKESKFIWTIQAVSDVGIAGKWESDNRPCQMPGFSYEGYQFRDRNTGNVITLRCNVIITSRLKGEDE